MERWFKEVLGGKLNMLLYLQEIKFKSYRGIAYRPLMFVGGLAPKY